MGPGTRVSCWRSFGYLAVHLLRDAVDHGLEPAEGREAAGKSPAGRLRLAAQRVAEDVVRSVEDDGAGIDWDAWPRPRGDAG
jgi:chemotaxis protein histidine kinase CheA